jgi:hypothetical protein
VFGASFINQLVGTPANLKFPLLFSDPEHSCVGMPGGGGCRPLCDETVVLWDTIKGTFCMCSVVHKSRCGFHKYMCVVN